MPGSCDSDKSSSPSLISSLRSFRFQNKKRAKASEDSSNSSSARASPNNSKNNRASSSSVQPSLNHSSNQSSSAGPTYSPLGYRKYKASNEEVSLLQHVKSKIRHAMRNNFACDKLQLKLSSEESLKLKELVSLSPSLSERWASDVTEEKNLTGSEKSFKIRLQYLSSIVKHIDDTVNKSFVVNYTIKPSKPIKTYAKASTRAEAAASKPNNYSNNTNDNSDLNLSSQKPGIMDDYEIFCEKETKLRKMLEAFPGADIMEAQDILVGSQWDLDKAMVVARTKPLRTTRKRSSSGAPMPDVSENSQSALSPNSQSNQVSNLAEEIVLDSSDEEISDNASSAVSNASSQDNVTLQSIKTVPKVGSKRPKDSSSDSEEESVLNHKRSALPTQKPLASHQTNSQKSMPIITNTPKSMPPQQPNVPKTITLQQVSVQKVLPPQHNSQKSAPSQHNAQKSVNPQQHNSQKSMSTQQLNVQKSVQSQNPKTNSVNLAVEKNVSTSQSLSVKSLPSTVASKELPQGQSSSNMPNLPKGLVISKVQSSNSSENKSADSSFNGSAKNISETSPASDAANIPSRNTVTNTKGNKSAHLVRIKANTSLSITPSDKDSEVQGRNSPSLNKTETTNKAEIGSTKSISIKPGLSHKLVSITPVTKSLSITPVTTTTEEKVEDTAKASKSQEGIKSKKHTGKVSVPKGKRKKCDSEAEEEEEYGNEDIYDSEDSECEENLTSAHSSVLKFFQEASAEELAGIPGCSKKKVEAILSNRPFNKWVDLVDKLRNDRSLSTDMLNGAKKVIDMRNAITRLMTKCQQISLDMEDLVENLKENRESSKDYVSKQPDLLNNRMHLTAYQLLGLNWLLLLHNQEVNGILADEMGLGKTVQAIAFLAYLKEINISGPHLIVVPSSTLDNWKKELEIWWPAVSVICYHGAQEMRRELRMQILNDEVEEFDIMITTYNMVTSSAEDRNFFKRLEFLYVVFDEAHMLKNMASQRYQSLMRIKAPRRLLLTGTPLQNNLVELMSLLIFAMPNMFSGKIEQIKQMFTCVAKTDGNKNSYEKDRIDHAKRIMKPFVLRRLKREVLKELPEKIDEIKSCPMTEDQLEKYKDLVARFSAEVENDEEKPATSSGAGMMMQLRRAANHPLLLRRIFNDDVLLKMAKLMLKEPTHSQSDPNLVFEDMSVMSDFELHKLCKSFKTLKSFVLSDETILNSGKFKVLESLLPTMIEQDHRILLFSQFTMVLDIIEEYMNIKGYKFLRLDGQTPVVDRQQLIDEFNGDPEILVFLLSTKAGGLGINLTSADTVILHDIDFNPYNDKQAEDRCHRVGQIRNVTVIRLISENTIEEGILQRAKEKLKLEKDIHEENESEEHDMVSVAKLLRDALGLKAKS